MPSYVTPRKNTAFVFYVSLLDATGSGKFRVSPTLATGDVLVATDDGAPGNIAILPVVDADFTKRLKVNLSASEMNGDNITVIFSDVAGAEWCDLAVNIQTTAIQIDDFGTIEDKLDSVKLVTDRLNVMSVQQVVASSAGNFTITAGITFNESVSGLIIPSNWETAIWTLKQEVTDTDAWSVIQIRKSNPADVENDGLQILNRSSTLPIGINNNSAALTINQAGGIITVYLTDNLTVLLSSANDLGWDIKFIDSNGDSVGHRGTADIVLTETEAII